MTNESPYPQLNLLSNEAGCDVFSHVSESQIIEKARDILAERLTQADVLTNPSPHFSQPRPHSGFWSRT